MFAMIAQVIHFVLQGQAEVYQRWRKTKHSVQCCLLLFSPRRCKNRAGCFSRYDYM